MYHRKLSALLALLAMAAGGSALAGTAHASVVGTIAKDVVDNDPVQVLGDSEVTLVNGNVAFGWGYGGVTPRLTGTLHVVGGNNARYRVKVDAYDRANHKLGSTYDTTAGTPIHTNDPKDVAVDMTATSAPFVNRLVVSVQKQGTGSWFTKASNDTPYLTLHDDDVQVLGDGIDVGGLGFYAGNPTGPAKLSWALGDDGSVTASYSGYVHFDDFSRCGRVVLRSLTPTGFQTGEVKGPQHCPTDNSHQHYDDTLAVPATTQASRVQVALQSKTGGVWQDVNTQTVGIAE
jgi:hypothetical protein